MAASLKQDSAPEINSKIQRIEDRSDRCHETLGLLRHEWNLAAWLGLVQAVNVIEDSVPVGLYGTEAHSAAVLNASRTAAQLYKFARVHGADRTLYPGYFEWTRCSAREARDAFLTAFQYGSFCTAFPFWHANMYAAELLNDSTVRFVSNASPLKRRVTAYQQGIRPKKLRETAVKTSLPVTAEIQRLCERSLNAAMPFSNFGVRFGNIEEFYHALYRSYDERTATMMRRYPKLSLGEYDLHDFRKFYSAILAVAGTHDFLNFKWKQRQSTAFESAVVLEHRNDWVRWLSELSGLSKDVAYLMIRDITAGRVKINDLHLSPFIPLTETGSVLALAPMFPLYSNWEDNILRSFSDIDRTLYLKTTETKEEEMRERLVGLTSGTRLITRGTTLPVPNPDIDLIVEDLQSGILIIAELKWSRKAGTSPYERRNRDKEVAKGVSQITAIRHYLESHPRYLYDRKAVTRVLSEYKKVLYCVIARDHLIESTEPEYMVFGYDAVYLELRDCVNTDESLRLLQAMEWLPEEGVDFHVRFERQEAGGVAIDVETYFSPQGLLPLVLK